MNGVKGDCVYSEELRFGVVFRLAYFGFVRSMTFKGKVFAV